MVIFRGKPMPTRNNPWPDWLSPRKSYCSLYVSDKLLLCSRKWQYRTGPGHRNDRFTFLVIGSLRDYSNGLTHEFNVWAESCRKAGNHEISPRIEVTNAPDCFALFASFAVKIFSSAGSIQLHPIEFPQFRHL
jgi:hypothetical protein